MFNFLLFSYFSLVDWFYLSFIPFIYCRWSGFYSFFESLLYGWNVPSKEGFQYDGLLDPCAFWYDFANRYKYKTDRWYMLGDVASPYYCFLGRGGGDCDDFARFARFLFGNRFVYKNPAGEVVYDYFATISLVYSRLPHHFVAVWKGSDGSVFVVSTQLAFVFSDYDAFVRRFCIAYDPRRTLRYMVAYLDSVFSFTYSSDLSRRVL